MAEDPLAALLDRLRQVPVAPEEEPAVTFRPAEAAPGAAPAATDPEPRRAAGLRAATGHA